MRIRPGGCAMLILSVSSTNPKPAAATHWSSSSNWGHWSNWRRLMMLAGSSLSSQLSTPAPLPARAVATLLYRQGSWWSVSMAAVMSPVIGLAIKCNGAIHMLGTAALYRTGLGAVSGVSNSVKLMPFDIRMASMPIRQSPPIYH